MGDQLRGYSREFPVGKGKPRRQYYLPDIPAQFWIRVRAKAKRERVSMRTLILRRLAEWLADGAARG
jgi:hypothetical protein